MAGIETWCRVRFGWAANPTQSLAGVTWTDETARVRSVEINRGRSKWPGSWPAGTATLVLANTTGALDLADATYGTRLKPGRAVIVEGKDSGAAWRPLFTGHVRPRGGYEPHDTVNDSTLTVIAQDLMGTFADVSLTSTTPAAGTVAAYFAAALASAGYSSVDQAIDAAITELATGTQAWTGALDGFLRKAAASDGGEVYCLKDGTLNFDRRHAVYDTARLNASQATISDDAAAGTVAALVSPGVRRTWGDRMATTVTVADYSGTTVSVTETGGIGYAAGKYDVGATWCHPDHAAGIARYWAKQTSVVDAWPVSCSVLVATAQQVADADHQDFACNRELRDRVTFEHTVPGRSQEVHAVMIESIRHSIDPSGWRMGLSFVSADLLDGSGWADWARWGGTYSRWGGTYADSDWVP